MTPEDLAGIQAALERVAGQLRGIERELGELVGSLTPVYHYDDDMLEGARPYDLAAELFTALECLLADFIRPAIELATEEARVTPETVQQAWWLRNHRGCGEPDL